MENSYLYSFNIKNVYLCTFTYFQGDYFPAIATFKNAKVKLNFGPRFKFSPPKNLKVRPMCERAEEVVIEQSLSDMKFFTENEGKLGLNNYLMSP